MQSRHTIKTGKVLTYVGIVLYCVIIVFIVAIALPGPLEALFADYAADIEKPLPNRALGHFKYMKRHLEQPFTGYKRTQVFVSAFSVVLLSHTACGLLNVAKAEPSRGKEIAPLLDEVTRRALSPLVSPYQTTPEEIEDFNDYNLYLSHLNLILGCRRLVCGDNKFDQLHEKISRHLVAVTLADGDYHARSFPGSPKFPADQVVTLLSLYMYDKCHDTDISREPIAGWLNHMKEHATDSGTGLHRSSLTASYPGAEIPRGCALSWSTLYMAQFAPEEATELYTHYRTQYFKNIVGCGGFREWPEGTNRGMDVDSGPIVAELGMAATGLGLGPARMYRDRRAYTAIMNLASTVGMPTVLGEKRSYIFSPLLGEAILFHGMTARCWFGQLPETDFSETTPFPVEPLISAILLLALAGTSMWRLQKHYRRARTTVENSAPLQKAVNT